MIEEGNEYNSFKVLERQQEEEYAKNINRVKNSIDGNLNGLSFITKIIDIYFAKVAAYMVAMTKGTESESSEGKGQ